MTPTENQVPQSSASGPEIVPVDPHASGVKCDGGNGALGHPVVYYAFDGKPYVRCLYCDRLFVRNYHQ